jgi:hypothetical protein
MFHVSVKPVMIHRAATAFWLADESSPASIRRLVLFLDDQCGNLRKIGSKVCRLDRTTQKELGG